MTSMIMTFYNYCSSLIVFGDLRMCDQFPGTTKCPSQDEARWMLQPYFWA